MQLVKLNRPDVRKIWRQAVQNGGYAAARESRYVHFICFTNLCAVAQIGNEPSLAISSNAI